MFGSIFIRDGEESLGPNDFGGVKPRQVLELLLLSRGHAVTVDALAEALWPDRPPKNVAATVNTYVCVLRQRLSADRGNARRRLVTSTRSYRLDTEGLSVDVDEFDALVDRAEHVPRQERIPLLQRALEVAHGDLLEDAPFDSWVQSERQRYREEVVRAHLTLSRDWLVEQRPGSALRHAETALTRSPFSEEAVRLAMIANHAMGLDHLARRAFERCRATLADQLDIDPTSETEDVAGAIEAGVPARELIEAWGDDLRAHALPPALVAAPI